MDYSYDYGNDYLQGHDHMYRTQQPQQPQFVVNYDAYVYTTLQSVLKKEILIETVRGSIHGTLVDVKPDHAVLESHGKQFFVRIAQIVFIMPL